MDESISKPSAGDAGAFELGEVLGERRAFGVVAGRSSAAEAACLRRIRNEKLYTNRCEDWGEFCRGYLGMSKTNANRIIQQLEEFGAAYFELSQLTRISPETFRAIAPAVHDNELHVNGEAIALIPENATKVAAAVAELRRAAWPPLPTPSLRDRVTALDRLARELEKECSDLAHAVPNTREHETFIAILGHLKLTLARLEGDTKG